MCIFAERDNSETVCLFWLERKPWNIIYYILYTWYAEGIQPPPPKPLAPHPKISVAPSPTPKNLTPNPWKTSHFSYIPCPLQYVLIDRRVEISIPTDHIQEDILIQTKII